MKPELDEHSVAQAEPEERCVLWLRGVLERDAAPSAAEPWLDRTLRDAEAGGGRIELSLGLTVIVSLDGIDLDDAVELARHALDIARECSPPVAVHIGLALGNVSRELVQGSPSWSGAVFDRAQVLSQRARPYEIVFDEAAEQRGDERWLFGREVFSDRVRGHALEAIHYSKRACRAALAQLRPAPLPPSAVAAFEQLHELTTLRGQQRAALHASSKATALDCVERLLALQPPTLRIVIGSAAGALRPLGGLALALRRLWPAAQGLGRSPLSDEQRAVFAAIMEGGSVQRSDAVDALGSLLRDHTSPHARPSLVFEELPEIDPATLAVFAEVLMAPELDAFVIMTLPLEATVPAQLTPAEGMHELYVPALPVEDRIGIVEAVLSLESGSDIAQRVAMLGGPHLHGLLEAVRTLVSSGDLIWANSTFVWRRGPRQGGASVPVEALLTERVVGLMPDAYRVLEVLCSCPRQVGRDFARAIAARDGLSAEEFRVGLEPLYSEGWIDAGLSLGPADTTVRGIMRNLMPPARAAELQSYVAELLRESMPEACFGSGEIAYHLLEAGQVPDAATALVDAAHSAMDAGFQRMALRLLATAVEWEPSTQIRKAARQIARSVGPAQATELSRPSRSRRPPSIESESAGADYEDHKSDDLERPERMAKSAMRSALDALSKQDFEATERWIDAALAAGASRAAAQRVLAVSHVARGDLDSAIAALQRSHDSTVAPVGRARDTLCWSIVRLAAGYAHDAVRVAFTALALARQLGDAHGEAACLQVLALAYCVLGREADAQQLEAAAASRLRAFVPLSHPA